MGKGWRTVFMGAEGGLCLEVNDGKNFCHPYISYLSRIGHY
jgi:hypothetical protein